MTFSSEDLFAFIIQNISAKNYWISSELMFYIPIFSLFISQLMIYDLTVGQPFHVLQKYDVGLLWLMIKKGSIFLLITIRK